MSSLRKRPRFNGPIEGYVVNMLRTNFWRVERSMQRQDVLQEAYCVFLRVQAKYPEVEMGPHFMALFKIAWHNEFNELANTDTKLRAEVAMPTHRGEDGEDGAEIEQLGGLDCDGPLAIAIEQAPAEVKAVLALFLNAPAELLEMALRGWNGRNKKERTGGSRRICALLGLDPNLDVLAMTEAYFTSK